MTNNADEGAVTTPVTTKFVRRHYSMGPTAYNANGSVARMPSPEDVDYAGRQFDEWLDRHDAEVRAALSTPPADDVREAVAMPNASVPSLTAAIAQAEQSVARHESQNAGDPFHFDLTEHMYVALRGLLAALSAPLRASLLRLDINPLDAWTVDEWAQVMDMERARQIADGYDDSHDAEHGIPHLLNWSIDYARRGKNVAAATLARCALRLLPAEVRPRGTVTEASAKEEAVTRAYNEVTGIDGQGWNPDRTLGALNTLWDAATGVRS